MKPTELLLFLLVAWTVIGVVGIGIRLARGDRSTALRHIAWLAGIWAVYMAALFLVSAFQPQHRVAMGQDQCFDEMCFAVIGAEPLPGYLIHDSSHLLRVKIRVTNHAHGRPQGEGLLHAYLTDDRGRTWTELPGLSGNRLTSKVAAGESILSEPVYRIPNDATEIKLVFTHGRHQPGTFVIGDSDSLYHRSTVVPLTK